MISKPESEPCGVAEIRGAVLREAAESLLARCPALGGDDALPKCPCAAVEELRRMADEAQPEPETRPARGDCPVCERPYKLTTAGLLPRHVAHVPDHRAADGLYCRGVGVPAAGVRQPDTETECPTPLTHNWGCGCPSDVNAAIASCPGREMDGPSPCRCPCEGCKHNCGAHNPAAVQPGKEA